MHPILPGGMARLGQVGELGGAAMALATLHPAAALSALPMLAASSPRLMGEAAYGLGLAGNAIGQLPGIAIGRGAYQFGRLPQTQ